MSAVGYTLKYAGFKIMESENKGGMGMVYNLCWKQQLNPLSMLVQYCQGDIMIFSCPSTLLW